MLAFVSAVRAQALYRIPDPDSAGRPGASGAVDLQPRDGKLTGVFAGRTVPAMEFGSQWRVPDLPARTRTATA